MNDNSLSKIMILKVYWGLVQVDLAGNDKIILKIDLFYIIIDIFHIFDSEK